MNQEHNRRALLVSMNLSLFDPKRLDRGVTTEVTTNKQASSDAGAYLRRVIPKSVIEPVRKAADATYQAHRKLTSPWADGGTRILCVDNYERYMDEVMGSKRLFDIEVSKFLKAYDDIRRQAPARMGLTYNPKDYPPVGEVENKFGINIAWTPIPSGSDFRLNLQDDELNELAADVDRRVDEAVENARLDLHHRLKERLEKVSERLSDPDNVFRDSLIENLRELCHLIPDMCIKRDPRILRAVDAVVQGITCHEAQDLRDDDSKRADAKRAADDILAMMFGQNQPAMEGSAA